MKKVLGTLALVLLVAASALASTGSRAACDPACCVGDDDVATCVPACDPAPSCSR
jgi:hypothetical protein